MAQLVVVVDVLVAERDADDPLPDQGGQSVHHLVLLAAVSKARRDPLDHAERTIRVPQQQRTAIRGHGAGIERRHHPAPSEPFKLELFSVTLCAHRTPCPNLISV